MARRHAGAFPETPSPVRCPRGAGAFLEVGLEKSTQLQRSEEQSNRNVYLETVTQEERLLIKPQPGPLVERLGLLCPRQHTEVAEDRGWARLCVHEELARAFPYKGSSGRVRSFK